MRILGKFLPVLLFMFTLDAASKELVICTDQNYWYPFTYVKERKAAGVHIEIVEKALTDLGYSVIFKPLPWLRCLKEAAVGNFHAVVSASYKDDRAQQFNYPPDAQQSSKSDYRITQAEYVVVSPTGMTYEYTGELKTLPRPVRSVLGYSIVDHLTKEGISVSSGRNTQSNLRELVRRKVGVVITTSQTAELLNSSGEFRGLLHIHPQPIISKSYFIVFPKLGSFPDSGAQMKIWEQVQKLRRNSNYFAEVFSKY